MKLQKILDRFLRLHPKEIDLSLNRIDRLSKELGYPQNYLNIISVTGTNGKYSTSQILKSILIQAGYKCNVYLSPHIKKINERFIFNNKEISDAKLCKLLLEVEKVNKQKPITFFEILTAAFFLGASRTKADITILESGLFNRFDACSNIKKNIASVITPIGLDHLDWLPKGKKSIDRVIYEKTSNLLKSKIIISEQSNKKIISKIKKTISKNKSKKIIFKKNFNYLLKKNYFYYIDNKNKKIKLPLPNLAGKFQVSNAVTAIATIKNLKGYKVSNNHIRQGITKIKSIARLQEIKNGKLKKISKDSVLLLDGSHNPLGASVISKYLDNLNKKKIFLILGMMNNKDHKSYISHFKNKVASITAIDIPNQKACIKKEKLKKIIDLFSIKSSCAKNIECAIENIANKNISKKNTGNIILITGSLYLAGEVLNRN